MSFTQVRLRIFDLARNVGIAENASAGRRAINAACGDVCDGADVRQARRRPLDTDAFVVDQTRWNSIGGSSKLRRRRRSSVASSEDPGAIAHRIPHRHSYYSPGSPAAAICPCSGSIRIEQGVCIAETRDVNRRAASSSWGPHAAQCGWSFSGRREIPVQGRGATSSLAVSRIGIHAVRLGVREVTPVTVAYAPAVGRRPRATAQMCAYISCPGRRWLSEPFTGFGIRIQVGKISPPGRRCRG